MSVSAESLVANHSIYLPQRKDYADFNVDVRDIFKLPAIFDNLRIKAGRTVAMFFFRSEQKEEADPEKLAMLDEKALLAAEETEGFVHYQPIPSLSYCIWDNFEAAKRGTSSEDHREAAKYAAEAYKRIQLLKFHATKLAVNGQVELVEVQ